MDTDKLKRWLTLGANIGVLSGLILVALQINQNSEIAKAQLANDYYLADMQLERSMMGENPIQAWVKAVYSPNEMTPEDAAILDRYFNFGLVQLNRLRKLEELGLADEEMVRERVGYLRWHLGNEAGRKWWTTSKRFYAEEFANLIDEALAKDDFGSNRRLIDSMLPGEADAAGVND